MKALVLGAGIIGITTAYYLKKAGFDVTVIDRQSAAGMETSFANGGQLAYSYVSPLASAGVLKNVPKWLLNPDSPMRMKLNFRPSEICWNLKFIAACNERQHHQTTAELLTLSYLTRDLIQTLRDTHGFEFAFSQKGKLIIHRSPESFEHAKAEMKTMQALGCEQYALDREACLEKEPALSARSFSGGIYTPSEQAADCYLLCQALQTYLAQEGVSFVFNTNITGFITHMDKTVSVQTSQGSFSADHIICCLASDSTDLLSKISVNVPISPLKGYSLTLDIEEEAKAPQLSITDYERKVVYTRLGHKLRVAGIGDRVGMDRRIDPERIRTMIKEAKDLFPIGNYDQAQQWAGLRPSTPTGKPIIDRTAYKNLWLNTGHGMLGFTLSMGSAKLITELILKEKTSIDTNAFRL
ncbi:D-amino acid dehydrogenase [Basilea psittacipulmonis]|uniref:Amino acid dehydrogenase n=1 Tax=Basilea psittacipulmonis DSM 24701 TaxID=1072685 RepID=A0A077DGK7_9BURK|nr:D-amino acid dehydrogenase [Basilea psittacipulmonis]AIL32612.1 amino acid dehydrogenase [Basilea psittacipulmonis DSM 24701]